MSFLETSALEATNVDESFKTVLEVIYEKAGKKDVSGPIGRDADQLEGDPIRLDRRPDPRKKTTKCC